MTKIPTAATRPQRSAFESRANSMDMRSTGALIQWPTVEELDRVSAELKRISEIGICSEVNGDYFTSGELAYQLHQILRTTRELLKMSLRRESP